MDRNREARRASIAVTNGVSRRRYRSGSLRDSPDEDGPAEIQEPMARLRDRGLKKDRDRDHERDRDRERDRSSRSKRRRCDRLIHGSHREDGIDDTSEESVNSEEDEYDNFALESMAMLPSNPVQSISSSTSNHQYQHRKILQPVASRNFRGPPPLKPADEMIGVSVPRKARSASTKRMHDWTSGGVGGDLIHRQESASPIRPSPAAPVSPSSSNASVRKMKPNGAKRPPKSSKTFTSNPEELEIEIAEVLYGLRAQSQGPFAKDVASSDTSKLESKSRVSSPVLNAPSAFPQSLPLLTQNSSSSGAQMSAVAPKRKKPRQVSENPGNFSSRSSPVSSATMKMAIDQHLVTEISSISLEKISGTPVEISLTSPLPTSTEQSFPLEEMKLEASAFSDLNPSAEVTKEARLFISTKKEVTSRKESPPTGFVAEQSDVKPSIVASKASKDSVCQKEEKFQIDLMAPPTQVISSPDRTDVIHFPADGASNLVLLSNVEAESEKGVKVGNGELVITRADEKSRAIIEESLESKCSLLIKESNIELKLLQIPEGDISNMRNDNGNVLQQEITKVPLQSTRIAGDEIKKEKPTQSHSYPLSMTVASWPGGLPPMGYMAPLQGLVSMEGNPISSAPILPLFSQPRVKRCATHYHIAQNIHYIQQLMKPAGAVAGSVPLFGAKPCNFNVLPPAEFNGNITGRSMNLLQDKGQIITIFPSNPEKDKSLLQTDQRKHQQQPVLHQQTVPPNNILHGPAFIFPFNQQQAAAASVKPGSVKSPSTPVNVSSNSMTGSGSTNVATSATTMSFNYPNMSPNEAQYLAMLQNNGYPFPVAAPPNYRGTHPQALPIFNGSFYPSQMIHPSQLQPHAHQHQQAMTSASHHNATSGSSLSQKHLQSQQNHQRTQASSVSNGTGSGNFQNFPAPKNRQPLPPQQQNNEGGGKDSPSVLSSRPQMYNPNFAMSIHPLSFALVTPNQNEKKPLHQQSMPAGAESNQQQMTQNFAMSFSPASSSADIERKSGSQSLKSPPPAAGHSIAFSRSDIPDSPGGGSAAGGATDGSKIAPPVLFNVSPSHLSSMYQNQKLDQQQQQQLMKLHKLQQQQHQHHHDQQQQQQMTAAVVRSKIPAVTSSNGGYPEHLTSSVKFQNVLANFPQPYKQQHHQQKNTSTSNRGSSPPATQSSSPQWKNTSKTPNTRVPSSLSSSTQPSLKNHVQQQARLQQISFGSTQKPSATSVSSQPQPPTNLNQSPSAIGSPTHSSVSRGTSGSPRSITASTSNKTGQNSTLISTVQTQKPSILGNPPNLAGGGAAGSQIQQVQYSKQAMQQAHQLLFSNNNYMQQAQGPPHPLGSTVSASSGYYLQRKQPEQKQQSAMMSAMTSSSGMMMLCPVSGTESSSSDPSKTVSAVKAHSPANMHQMLPTGFPYVTTAPVGVQAKPPEQKQPAGEPSRE